MINVSQPVKMPETGARYTVQNPGFLPASPRPYRHPPMMANSRAHLGILKFLGNVAVLLLDGLNLALDTLADIVELPLNLLADGVEIAFNGVAGIMDNIPLVGPLLSQIVLVGGAIIKFGLTVPGLLLRGLGNILEGVAKALDEYMTPDEKEKNLEEQKEQLEEGAPDHIKENVKAVLDAGGIGATNTQDDVRRNVNEGGATTGDAGTTDPNDPRVQARADELSESTIEKLLPVALPVAAGGLVLALILS